MKFYYLDEDKKVYLTLKKGAPEWANLDCPAIYIEGDKSKWNGWTLLSNCLVMEDGNEELYDTVRNFVKKSGEAFYKKYPSIYKGKNGFLHNFDMNIAQYHPNLERVA